jgi:hypothetical protein
VERVRNSFDRKSVEIPSCGCYKKERVAAMTENRTKPDCTGQRFGRLVVLGKSGTIPDRDSYRQLWKCQCDCGNVVEIPRGNFDSGKQVSCGCLKRERSGRKIQDITGRRFGNLQAIKLTGRRDQWGKPTWKLQCDCGNTCELSLRTLNHKQRYNLWLNCGDKAQHPENGCWYPPTPNPYPKEAGELLKKYLHLTELTYEQIKSAVEDEKRDRLLRAAWILTYRRSLGEDFSELYEMRFIKKHLRYCSIDVFWQRKLEQQGGLLYTASNNKKEIGSKMANVTSNDYPELEIDLRGTNILPISVKRLKFKRC